MKQFTPSRPKRIGDDSPELVPTEKRKRRSGELISLGLSAHELKYRKETQKGEMLRASMLRRKMVVFYLLDLLE